MVVSLNSYMRKALFEPVAVKHHWGLTSQYRPPAVTQAIPWLSLVACGNNFLAGQYTMLLILYLELEKSIYCIAVISEPMLLHRRTKKGIYRPQ